MKIIEDFETYLYANKGLANTSVNQYKRYVSKLINYLNEFGLVNFKSLESDHIRYFISTRMKDMSENSIFASVIAFRAFFKFLRFSNKVDSNFSINLPTPKLWKKVQDCLSEGDMQALLNSPDRSTSIGKRDKAILEVMYASGLRVSELCDLYLSDINKNSVIVRLGKGGRARIVPLGTRAQLAIDEYLTVRSAHKKSLKSNLLFVNINGRKLTRLDIWRRIKYYSKLCGIDKNVHPHSLRRSFATHLHNNDVDLLLIKEMMGHSSISTTELYIDNDINNYSKIVDSLSPNRNQKSEDIWKWTQ